MIVKLTIEVNLSDEVYGGSKEELDWMISEILIPDGSLLLLSNEMGDTIGEVVRVSNIKWITKTAPATDTGDHDK